MNHIQCFYKRLPLKGDKQVSKETHSSDAELGGILTKKRQNKPINDGKLRGTSEAMAKSARSH